MVEVEKVLEVLIDSEEPLTSEQIAERCNCSKDAVENAIMFINRNRKDSTGPKVYMKTRRGLYVYSVDGE